MDTLTIVLFFIMVFGISGSTIAFAWSTNKNDHNLEYFAMVLFFIAMFILPAAFFRQYDKNGFSESLDIYSEKVVEATIWGLILFTIAMISVVIYAYFKSDDSDFRQSATTQIRKNKAKRKAEKVKKVAPKKPTKPKKSIKKSKASKK